MKMKKNISFLFSLAIVLAVLFSLLLSSCGGDTPQENVTTEENVSESEVTEIQTTAETEAVSEEDEEPRHFSLNGDYRVITPDASTDDEVAAMKLMIKAMSEISGINLHPTTDFVREGSPVVPYEYEILIGETNRKESAEFVGELSYSDYGWKIFSENVIVISGGGPEGTYKALCDFLSANFGYVEGKGNWHDAELLTGTSFVSRSTYKVNEILLDGQSIFDYTIVSSGGKDCAAREVNRAVGRLCGKTLEIVKPRDFKGGRAIFVGCSDANGNHLDKNFDEFTYYITSADGNIIIDFKSKSIAPYAGKRFADEYFPQGSDRNETLNVTIRKDMIAGVYVDGESNNLSLKDVTKRKLADGIEYSERYYTDKDGKPVRAYVLTVQKGSGTLYTGTPADSVHLENNGATVKSEMIYALSNGKNVIAGVNADFFAISGNYLPTGLCVKDGVKLNDGKSDRPFFAAMKDGSAMILKRNQYTKYSSEILNAVGGSHIVLLDGKVSDVGAGTDFGTTRHPRTGVGIRQDGTVVLVVVDGRQKSLSNGASLADLAGIFRDLDCDNALNLDGGGSSCMVLRDIEKNTYTTVNSPSDGSLRVIQNSLIVVLPE